ncbi:hypothetical protein ACFVH9_08365 [Streptomyces hirsutus]|uniref:hypothetical protein n=1 Tax=Streptomyces hirsutus TaxID=35620 RepID=UPI00363C9441
MNASLTPTQVTDLGTAVGKIAGLAARSLHESFPHLDLEQLVETFTRDSAIAMIGTCYLAGLDSGKTPGEAAADAGTTLIRAWADARLAARAELDQQGPTPRAWEVCYRDADSSPQVSKGHTTRAAADDVAAGLRAHGFTGVKVVPAFASPREALGYRNRHAARRATANADLTS